MFFADFFLSLTLEKSNRPSFFDLAQQGRKSKTRDFLRNVDQIIDWRPIQNIIHKHYTKGHSASGQPSVAGLVLFKMLLLQTWYGLSDYQVEDRVNDSFAFSEFIGLPLDFSSPDHSLVSKFRTELTKTKAFEKLFKEVTKQLMKKGIIVKEGAIVDATLTRSPRSPKGKATYEITNDREDPKDPEQEKEQLKLVKVKQPGVDDEARWVYKGGDFTFGYKSHAVSDPNGLFIKIHTTEANVNEISNLEEVLANVPIERGARLFGDKGYRSKKNEKLLKKMGLKNGIMHKKSRGKSLSRAKQEMNAFITQHRYPIERSFGGIKRWFNSGVARYVGLEKTHTQHLMEAIAYHLKRSPGIVMSMS